MARMRVARSAKLVPRHWRKAALARASVWSICSSVNGSKLSMTSPLAGLMDWIAMSPFAPHGVVRARASRAHSGALFSAPGG